MSAESKQARGHGAIDVGIAAAIIIDSLQVGDDGAAKMHGVGVATVRRWRKRMQTDPELHELVAAKRRKLDEELGPARRRAQRVLLDKITALAAEATLSDLATLAEAYRNISEIDLASEALGVGNRDPQPGAPAPEAGDAADSDAED